MAASHETVLFDVDDFKVYPLVDDTGASPVYGTAVDVPGIAEVGLDPNLLTAELKGDGGRVLAKRGKIDRFNFSATYGKLDLDALEVLIALQVEDFGSDAGEVARGRYKAGTQLPEFLAAFQVLDVEGSLGALTVVAYKCQVTGGTLLGQSTDEFGQPTVDFEATGLQSTDAEWTDVMLDLTLEEPDAVSNMTGLPVVLSS